MTFSFSPVKSSVWSRLKGFLKKIWRSSAGTETPGLLHPVNSITLGTETLVAIELAWDGPLLVPELCSAMFGLEAGELGRGGGRGREPELV